MFRYFDWVRGVNSTYNNGVLYNGVRYHEESNGTCNATTDNCTTVAADYQVAATFSDIGDNFFSGHFGMMSLIGVATYDNNPDSASYYNYVVNDLWNGKLKAYWNDTTYGKGGDAVEGWNYGGGFFREYQALWGMNTATGYNFFSETNHPVEVVKSYVNATAANMTDMYNHGQWSGSNIGKPYAYHIFMPKFILHSTGDTTNSGFAQSYMDSAKFVASGDLWASFIFDSIKPPINDYKLLPLYYWSQGSGLFSFHSSWDNKADSVSSWFQLGYGTRSTHENYDEGAFQVIRGNDKLIWDAGLQRDEWRQSVLRFGVSGITGSQKPWGVQWVLSDSVLAQEHAVNFDYVKADLRGGYQKYYYSSNSAEKYFKSLIYLRPNMFVIYDVTKTDPTNPNKWKDWQTQYPGLPTTDLSMQTITFTNGSSKVFVKTLYPLVGYTTALESDIYNYVQARPTKVQEYDQFLHVIEATASTTSQTPSEKIQTAEGKMIGAYIKDATKPTVVFFSADKDGNDVSLTTGEIISFTIATPSTNLQQMLVHLVPNSYLTLLPETTTNGLVTYKFKSGNFPDEGTVYKASSQGVISFLQGVERAPAPPAPPTGAKKLNVSP